MSSHSQPEHVRPAPLQPGDTVGIVAPSSGFRRDEFEAGCAHLLRLGYQPFYLPSIFERDLYFGGTVERRVEELHEMFARPEVKAILCARRIRLQLPAAASRIGPGSREPEDLCRMQRRDYAADLSVRRRRAGDLSRANGRWGFRPAEWR